MLNNETNKGVMSNGEVKMQNGMQPIKSAFVVYGFFIAFNVD
jgi:hypothetical protein